MGSFADAKVSICALKETEKPFWKKSNLWELWRYPRSRRMWRALKK